MDKALDEFLWRYFRWYRRWNMGRILELRYEPSMEGYHFFECTQCKNVFSTDREVTWCHCPRCLSAKTEKI